MIRRDNSPRYCDEGGGYVIHYILYVHCGENDNDYGNNDGQQHNKIDNDNNIIHATRQWSSVTQAYYY